MAVGASVTRNDIDSTSAQVARQLFAAMESVAQFKAWLDTKLDDDLTNMGYSVGDVAVLRSATADLADLGAVFIGATQARGLPYDYRTFAKQLLGTGLY